MNKIKALIVDDEPPARQNLLALPRGDPEVEVVAAVACWLPARRAMRVDPVVALRMG